LRVSILIERGEDVERSKDIGYHEVQVSEGKVSPGTDPMIPPTFSIA